MRMKKHSLMTLHSKLVHYLVFVHAEKGTKEFRIRTMGLCSVQVRTPARRFDSKLSSKTMGKCVFQPTDDTFISPYFCSLSSHMTIVSTPSRCLDEARKKSGASFEDHISKLLTSRNKEGIVQYDMMMSNLGDARVAMREFVNSNP
jgi:hypothetical protein